jgi:hypothetical protein
MAQKKRAVNRKSRPGRSVHHACRYDPYRSDLVNQLRATMKTRTGKPYLANASLIVQDALDCILKREGLLPEDAPLYSDVVTGRLAGDSDAPQ